MSLPKPLAILDKPLGFFLSLADKTLHKFIFLFIIAGVVLSCMHQSSLGTLMVIAPTKMHPLWYTPISPLLFLLSAISVGFPMVIFESILASRSFKLKPEMGTLSSLARYIPVLLGVYLAAKVIDLTLREVWSYLLDGSFQSLMYAIEVGLGVVLPMFLLTNKKVRQSVGGLFFSASLVIFGVLLNRIDVFLVAYKPLYADKPYFPSAMEFMVTIGLICALVLVYRLIVMNFPVIAHHIDGSTAKPATSGGLKSDIDRIMYDKRR